MSAHTNKRKKRPPLRKRILKSAAFITLVSYLLAFVLRVLYVTNRIEKHIPAATLPYIHGEQPFLLVFWHGRLSMQAFMKPKRRRSFGLISPHADGLLISTVLRRFRIETVHGSSNRKARNALEGLLDVAAAGHNVAFTPDGPRGPFQKAAKGAAYVAIKTGLKVVAYSFSATRHVRFNSWDRFMLPKPFGRIVYVASEPIDLGRDDSDEAITAATQTIEALLNRITDASDRLTGVLA